jgi:hypothetical protein
LIEQIPLLNLGQTAQAVEQQTIDRLGGRAQGVGEGQVRYPGVSALHGAALAVEAREF